MRYGIFGLKTEILLEMDKKVVVLETRLESKVNETHQNTTTTLQDIKEIVSAV